MTEVKFAESEVKINGKHFHPKNYPYWLQFRLLMDLSWYLNQFTLNDVDRYQSAF